MLHIMIIMLLFSSAALAQRGVPSTVRLRVTDDAGAPVTNAAMDGCFLDDSRSGARDRFIGVTDTNGIVFAKGTTLIGIYVRFTRDGYYPTTVKQALEYKRKQDGHGFERPNRWVVDTPVLLKRIKHPITLYAKSVENPYVDHWETAGKYRLGCTSRYDIVKGDYLPLYGNGDVADVEFRWLMNIYSKDDDSLAQEYSTLCEICMTNAVDGIFRGTPYGSENGQTGSAFISDYEAPEAGYTNSISFYRNVRGSKVETNDDKHYLYYFRIRTQTNELGQVTNAFYGKIYGQLNGNFTYYLNPTPNDRNVEHDPKKNLFKGQ